MTDPPDETMPASGVDLETRYGRRRARQRQGLIVTAVALAAVGLPWLIWVAWAQSHPPVASSLRGFTVASDTMTIATVEVERAVPAAATCWLQARSDDFAVVGETTVLLPAEAARRSTLQVRIVTQRRATAAVLIGCTTVGSVRPR